MTRSKTQYVDPAYAPGNPVSDLFDMIRQLAPAMMRAGGGSIAREDLASGTPLTAKVRAEMNRMIREGKTLEQTALATGYHYGTVCRVTIETRRALGQVRRSP